MRSSTELAKPKTRILVADDHPFLREGVRDYLNRQDDLTVCGESSDVASTIAAVDRCRPHLVLLDLRLGDGDVLELIKSLRSRLPSLRILILSQHEEALYAERALRAGANGYVMKQEATDEVLAAIRRVIAGELYVSKKMAAALLSKLFQTPPATSQPGTMEGLSDREFQVFQMVGAGLGTRQIAAELNLSIKTIETYRENIKHKFGLRNASELVRHATDWLQNGGAGTLQLKSGTAPFLAPPTPPPPPP
jgi:DNA-binding NarL/FixJ family response regulator